MEHKTAIFQPWYNVTTAKPKSKSCKSKEGNRNKKTTFPATNNSFMDSAIVIVPLADVEMKIKDGYRYVNFSEVNRNEVLRGHVMKAVVKGNYYTDFALDGGRLTSKSLCKDESCNKKSLKLKLVADEHILNKLDADPEFAVMEHRLGLYYSQLEYTL